MAGLAGEREGAIYLGSCVIHRARIDRRLWRAADLKLPADVLSRHLSGERGPRAIARQLFAALLECTIRLSAAEAGVVEASIQRPRPGHIGGRAEHD